ncbi:MAG: UDP-N-acetylmuramoyl-tripeptide--D-alanyl-D-alanine ligase, partial [Hymenobacteraceae bacterium]|nr:UDP-N-acetylmuramoyl-tripeptide--D-alanyl-D-alanine ligase [Hymenobacteraceae bacterium]MDX5397865.1 UDP-N-acetylmuramoyl-tripeptide--D-alanyl-D-alanine ligase [Hymenobacteraceae bacterium]MDX5442427.1 UDP-N-acetylmuramoyl-tripeptide--D-alanyl-D-alanine ligase [Hymenobacteraceae bacterium]MDX5513936.1 UDP-N-acetylmuramoyl-tripeptide--D-alanyl-D-alanine ligase [Hymenobacteraceae bacterium]
MAETIESLYKKYLTCSSVSTDTRTVQPGALFVALNGPNFKGSQFAAQALEKGASYVITDDVNLPDNRCLQVEDTLKTLQDLANYHRQQLQIPVIGITGSNGKTTTKELINRVLSQKYKTLYTSGNLNNHIGVPLTLLRIKPEHEIAIIEMGANHQGEIDFLCHIANPTHGVITNIGKAHLEGFGGLEGVARGKSELYRYLAKQNGIAFVNSKNEQLMQLSSGIEKRILYPAPGDFYQADLLEETPFVVYRSDNGEKVETQLPGRYNFENMCVAACVGKYFEVAMPQVNEAIASYSPDNNRSQLIKTGSNTILLDAYNANPT